MFIWLWNFLRGYVKISIGGFSVERLVTGLAAAEVFLWDVRREGALVTAKLSMRDVDVLEALAIRTGSKVEVLATRGLPVWLKWMRTRVALFVGMKIFTAGLVLLASFIWRIDIVGTNRIDPNQMIDFLAQNGFSTGTFRHGIRYRDVESLLMAEFDDIAWVSVSITGTRALIELVETIPQPEVIDRHTPADIVARADGIIVDMATSRGTPLVRPGDVVAAGDVLVTGRLEIGAEGEEPTIEYVRAAAEVRARIYYHINFDIPLTFYAKTFTGQVQKVYGIIIGSREFTLPHRRHSFIYYDTITRRVQLGFGQDYPLPLHRFAVYHYELQRNMYVRTTEEARALGEELAARRITQELGGIEIVEKRIEFTEGERSVAVEIFLVTIERLDEVALLQTEVLNGNPN